jgi:hypothetical protein
MSMVQQRRMQACAGEVNNMQVLAVVDFPPGVQVRFTCASDNAPAEPRSGTRTPSETASLYLQSIAQGQEPPFVEQHG